MHLKQQIYDLSVEMNNEADLRNGFVECSFSEVGSGSVLVIASHLLSIVATQYLFVTPLGQQEVHGITLGIHSPIDIDPLAFHLDVGFVHPP